MTIDGILKRNGTGKTLMNSVSLKMMTALQTKELKAIAHQIIDSDGSVWDEKERVDVVYAMAQISSKMPGTK